MKAYEMFCFTLDLILFKISGPFFIFPLEKEFLNWNFVPFSQLKSLILCLVDWFF